tara:strand:- start:1456 stop:2262 length:807 start_codon:yes stop_codon:yes gene_type:complete
MDKKFNLLKYRKNFYSENGEDGIIEYLIKKLSLNDIQCCEFGAWDGKKFSNTFNLVKNYNARAVYIESDESKYLDLLETCKKYPNIVSIKKFISATNDESNIDQVLSKTFLKKNFEILSIDIDSNDLEIFESMKDYHPKIVIIEISSDLGPDILYRYGKDSKNFDSQGESQVASFSSVAEVCKNKGYAIVAHTGNLILVHNQFLDKINFPAYLIENPKLLFLNRYKLDNLFLNKKNNFFTMIVFFTIKKLFKLLPKNYQERLKNGFII